MTETIIRPYSVGGSPLTKGEVLQFENDIKRIFGGSKNYKKPGCRRARGSFDDSVMEKLSYDEVDIVAVNYDRVEDQVEGSFHLAGYRLDTEIYSFKMSSNEFGDLIAKVFSTNIDKARKIVRALKG